MTNKFIKFDLDSDSLNYSFQYNSEETNALYSLLNKKKNIDINDLRRISLWKINRILSVSDETINKLRDLANKNVIHVSDPFIEKIMNELVNSQGVGFPMASAILKFIKPDIFPIIDVRAYRALTGKKIYYSTYSYEKYVCYTNQLLSIAKKLKISLREVDEQLYCFDKENNGKI